MPDDQIKKPNIKMHKRTTDVSPSDLKMLTDMIGKVVTQQGKMQDDLRTVMEWMQCEQKRKQARWNDICTFMRNYVAPVAVGITLIVIGWYLGHIGFL